MLNTERIIKAFNAANNKRISAKNEEVVSHFVDLFMDGITDEMMLKVIDKGYITTKSDLLDTSADWVKAVYEAYCMDDDEPAEEPAKIEPAKIEPNPANPFGMFEQMIVSLVDAQSRPIVEKTVEEMMNAWIAANPSKVTQVVEYEFPKEGTHTDGVVHKEFNTVRAFIEGGEPVMLVGAAGSGKNYLCKQLADSLNLEFYFTNAVTQEYKLTGFIDANGVYHETQFYQAWTKGGLFMFDEFDASDENVLTVFNAALENGYFDFPNIGRSYAHPDFRVVAACNTYGLGADYQYVGRNQLDAATLDRFEVLPIDYDENIENCLTDDENLLRFIRKFRKACADNGIHHIVSYRAIRRLAKFKTALGCVESMKSGLLKNLERDDMNMIVGRFEDEYDEWSEAFKEIARGC